MRLPFVSMHSTSCHFIHPCSCARCATEHCPAYAKWLDSGEQDLDGFEDDGEDSGVVIGGGVDESVVSRDIADATIVPDVSEDVAAREQDAAAQALTALLGGVPSQEQVDAYIEDPDILMAEEPSESPVESGVATSMREADMSLLDEPRAATRPPCPLPSPIKCGRRWAHGE